jgi:hypothetical protein
VPIKVFLCYFAWLVDTNICKYWYGNAKQHQHQFVDIYNQIEQKEKSVQYGNAQQHQQQWQGQELNERNENKCFGQRMKI